MAANVDELELIRKKKKKLYHVMTQKRESLELY